MSGIAQLSDDLLVDVLILSTDVCVAEKFTVAQVSRRWRSLALSNPVLWSSFCLSTETDYGRLPIVLKRSGLSAPLDVELLAPLEFDLSSEADWQPVMQALVPYAARIRSFYAHVANANQIFAPRFDGNLDFPILEKLTLFTQNLPDDTDLPIVSARAPALRILELGDVDLRNLDALLSPTLFLVRLMRCSPASKLLSILECCPHLVYLEFLNYDMDEDTSFCGLTTISRRPLAPDLRSLNLRIPLEDILKVLDTGFANVVVPEISVAISNADNAADMVRLVCSLFRGMGPLVSFELEDSDFIVLEDDAGHARAMCVWGDDARWDVKAVWALLTTRYSIAATVTNLVVNPPAWNDLADALEDLPLQTPEGVGITMHVLANGGDIFDALAGELHLSTIVVPGLSLVDIKNPEDGELGLDIVREILLSLQDGCAAGCRVVLHGPVPRTGGVEIQYPDPDWRQSIRQNYSYPFLASRWEISFECSTIPN